MQYGTEMCGLAGHISLVTGAGYGSSLAFFTQGVKLGLAS